MTHSPPDLNLRNTIRTPEDGYRALAHLLYGTDGVPPDWHRHANCANTNTDDWFRGGRKNLTLAPYCHTCPVQDECRDDILTWEYRHALGPDALTGYTAGMTKQDRENTLRTWQRDHHQGAA